MKFCTCGEANGLFKSCAECEARVCGDCFGNLNDENGAAVCPNHYCDPGYTTGTPNFCFRGQTAVEALERVSDEEIETLLKIVEQQYAPWVTARQDRLDSLVMGTFEARDKRGVVSTGVENGQLGTSN